MKPSRLLSLSSTSMRSNSQTTILLLLASLTSLTSAQGILSSIPKCYQDCLVQSGDFTCNGLNIECMCRLSGGNFLTDVITCIRRDCDNNLNLSQLAGPIQLACASVGAPIDASVIDDAQSIDSSLAATAITTWTGVRTATSTFASAGTMYVVVVPLSASTGRFGIQTLTGSTRTVAAASITGDGQGLSLSSRTGQARGGSSSSSTTSSTGSGGTSTTVVTAIVSGPSVTTTTATSSETATATAAGAANNNDNNNPQAEDQGGAQTRQTGDGTPYVSSDAGISFKNTNQHHHQHKWWGLGVCILLAVGGLA